MVSFINNKLPPSLIRAVVVFILVIAVVLISIFVSYMYLDKVKQEKSSASRTMRLWQSKINSSVKSDQLIEKFEKDFMRLVRQGVVGKEERLSWFEAVQSIVKRRDMPLVKYSISSQTKLDKDNIKRDFPGIDVFKSTMTLNLKMGHEGDLFALLNDLEKAKGLFTIDQCNIEKIRHTSSLTINNMKAFCKLGWYTFKSTKLNTGKQGEK